MRKLLILAALLCPVAHGATIACNTTPGTYNASAGASWVGGVAPNVAGGDLITCGTTGVTIVFDVNYIIGNSPASGNVITFTGAAVLGIAQNITLTVQGGASVAGSIQFAAGSVLKFESASAGSPTATPYTLTAVTATADGTHPPTSGSRFLVTADTISGTNFRMANSVAGSGTSGWINGEIQNCGDPAGAAPCFPYTPGGSHGSLNFGGSGTPFVFDHTCGVTWGTGYTSADSWDFQNVSFENTYTACAPWTGQTGFNLPSGTRLFDTVVFDQAPSIETHGAIYDHSVFLKSYNDPLVFGPPGYAIIRNSLVLVNWQTGTLTWSGNIGNLSISDITLTNDVIVADPTTTLVSGTPTAQTAFASGTATAATSGTLTSTLTDSTKSFTTNTFAPTGFTNYMVCVTGGTGPGQCRNIQSNTATVITVLEKWDTTPDTSSTYAIYAGVFNGHWTTGTNPAVGTTVPTLSGNIFTAATLGDNNGDGWHGINSSQGATCNLWRAAWSNATAYAQWSAVSESGVFYFSTVSTTGNDPSTDGGVHWTVASTLASMFTGCVIYEMDNNIFLPSVTHDNPATFMTGGNARYIAQHNNYFTGAQSAAYAESRPAAFPGALGPWTANFAWAEAGKTYVIAGTLSALGPYVLADSGGPTNPPNYIFAAPSTCFAGGTGNCADYNGEYSLLNNGFCASVSGSNQGGSGAYNSICNSPMGTHDVVGNPQFVRPFPSPQSWAQTLGIDTGISDPVAIEPDVYKCLMKINDPSGWNTSCTVANLYTYLFNSMAFQNVAFHNAAFDGTDMGPVPFLPPVVTNFSTSGAVKFSGSVVIQ